MGLMISDDYTFADENNINVGVGAVKFGENISSFLKRKTITNSSFLEQFHEMQAFFDEFYYNYEEIINGRRVKWIMIPKDAFREAMANAIVYQDYLINANIRIEFWDDYIEIISPGGLPNGITEDELKVASCQF